MGIMGCYPDTRAVENELGGKWEKFYEYQFEETHGEGFEFPHDLDENESPLNLNGIKIVASATGSNNSTILFKVNGIEMINMATGFGNNIIEFYVKNGHSLGFWRANGVATTLANVHSTMRMLTTPMNNINSFEFSSTVNVSNMKIEFFVLRGV